MTHSDIVSKLMQILAEIDLLKEKNNEFNFKINELGKKALNILNGLLDNRPNDFQLLSLRIKLNSEYLFSDYDSIIADAYLIIDNPAFTKEKMLGYTWLIKLFDHNKTSKKDQIKIIENQLIDIHTYFDDHSELLKEKGTALFYLAKAYYPEDKIHAHQLSIDSYKAYPYLHSRNLLLGNWYLDEKELENADKYLWAHFLWGEHIDEQNMVGYGKKLWDLYDNNELIGHPNLIALMFHIIRNFKESFGCILNKDFYKIFGDKLQKEVDNYPNCSKLTVALANTYFLDLKDYENALKYYTLFLNGDAPNFQSYIFRIYECAAQTNQDFFNLPLKLDEDFESENLISSYYIVLDLYEIYEIENDIRYLKFAEKFMEQTYFRVRKFLIHGVGDFYNNIPNFFDYICLIYGKIFTELAKNTKIDILQNRYYKNAAIIHWEGYQFSNFLDNLDLAISNANSSGDHELCIYYAEGFANDYINVDATVQTFKNLFCLNLSYRQREDLKEMKFLYLKAKHILLNSEIFDTDIIDVFTNIAFDYFSLAVDKEQELFFLLPELEWIVKEQKFKISNKEIKGAILYYIGVIKTKISNDKEAKFFFKEAINILKEHESEDFIGLYRNAIVAYNSL